MSRADAEGFSGAALRWAIGLTGGSLLLALLFGAFAGDLEEPRSAGSDSFSYSALGHRALAEALKRAGFEVRRRRSLRAAGLDRSAALLITEAETGAPAEVALAARHGAPVILVLGKWKGEASLTEPDAVGEVVLLPPRDVLAPLRALGVRAALERRTGARGTGSGRGAHFATALAPAQLLEPAPGLVPVVACDSLILVARLAALPDSLGGGARAPVYVVSDPDLWNNQGLGRADHAALLRALLVDVLGVRGLVIDETVHGYALTRTLLAESVRYPLVLAVVQALLLAAFVVWAGVRRFGKPRAEPPPAGGNRALIEVTAKLLGLTGQTPDTLALYYAQTLQALRERFCLPGGLGEPQLAERLDEIGRSRGVEPQAVRMAQFIRSLRVSAASDNPEIAVDLALRLHRWREEITHGH